MTDNKKAFRPTPGQFQDSMRIIVGNKTNATIRDLEEEEGELEEKIGTVISIDRNKINGNGWVVQDEEGNTYNCSCASSMYDLPSTTERGGILYPNNIVTVVFTVNPVLKNNTIKEITSLGEEEQTLDISEWQHGDSPTTIIAKPKSAISVSDSMISFNYNNTNTMIADEQAVSTFGEKTEINTQKLNIKSDEIKIQDIELVDYITTTNVKTIEEYNKAFYTMLSDEDGEFIDIMQQGDMGQINLKSFDLYIPPYEIVIADLKNPIMFPEHKQKYPLLNDNIDELYIYPNGLVTIKAREEYPVDNKQKVLGTFNWVSPQSNKRNILTISIKKVCNCCDDTSHASISFFNYCPKCQTWNTLSEINSEIVCNSCYTHFCEACGHDITQSCNVKTYDLKRYNEHNILAQSSHCEYCVSEIPENHIKEYANYCPFCHKWDYLHTIEEKDKNKEIKKIFECSFCGKKFCINCSTVQDENLKHKFIKKDIKFEEYKDKIKKITFIRDDSNGRINN